MKDTFKIDGKIYISSRRAAEISRYSNDYVGQLCRGGKVDARMVGRTWFVDQDGLLEYKKNSEEALQARYRSASQAQHKMYAAVSSGAISLPSYPQSNWKFSHGDTSANTVTASTKKRTSVDWQRSVAATLIAVIVIVGGLIINRSGINISMLTDSGSIAGVTDSLAASADSVKDWFARMTSSVKGLFARSGAEDEIISSDLSTEVASDDNANPNLGWNGMAVVPTGADQDATQTRIKNSFSDSVNITPDESGTAGVITPVFKKTSGDDFMYVLVPVKERKE